MFGFSKKPAVAQDQRAAPRVAVPGALVRIDSKEFPIVNISVSGFLIAPYEGDLIVRQKLYLTLILPDGDKIMEFKTEARVARITPEGLGAYFIDLRVDARFAIEELLGRLMGTAQPT